MKTAQKTPFLFLALLLFWGNHIASVYSADYTNLRDNKAALKQLDNISMYRTVFASDNLPKYGSGNTGQNAFYEYADTTPITTDNRGWSGAIFYGQLTNKNTGATEWVLVDTPNYYGTNVYQLGISLSGKAEDVVNRVITGSNVYASYSSANMPLFSGVTADADGVKAIENTNVILEFWSFNYSGTAEASKLDQDGNAFTLSTNNAGGYDWNDTINLKDGNPTGDHGSWQIHVYDSTAQQGQSLFSMSRLYRTGEPIDAGIGDAYTTSEKNNDWTMVGNTASYDGRAMTVLAKPNYVAGDVIFNAEGATSDWGTVSNWLTETGTTATVTPTSENNVYVNMGNVTISGSATAKTVNLDHSASVTVQKNGALAIGSGFNIEGTFNSAGDTTVKVH